MSIINDSKYNPYLNNGFSDNPDSEPDDGEKPSEPITQSPSELPEAEITTTPHPADTSKKPRTSQLKKSTPKAKKSTKAQS